MTVITADVMAHLFGGECAEQRCKSNTGPATFGIFDTFKDDQRRSAHVNGAVAKALFARAEELFVTKPKIEMVDILAEK